MLTLSPSRGMNAKLFDESDQLQLQLKIVYLAYFDWYKVNTNKNTYRSMSADSY